MADQEQNENMKIVLCNKCKTEIDFSVQVEEKQRDDSEQIYDVIFNDDIVIETIVTQDPASVSTWVGKVETANACRLDRLIVGLDVQWLAKTRRAKSASSLHLSVGSSCLIYRLDRATNFPRRLRRFLGNDEIKFVGVGVKENADRLFREVKLKVANVKELAPWAAKELGNDYLKTLCLGDLAKEVVGGGVEKQEWMNLRRWDKPELNTEQVKFACCQAYLSFEVGRRLSAWYN